MTKIRDGVQIAAAFVLCIVIMAAMLVVDLFDNILGRERL